MVPKIKSTVPFIVSGDPQKFYILRRASHQLRVHTRTRTRTYMMRANLQFFSIPSHCRFALRFHPSGQSILFNHHRSVYTSVTRACLHTRVKSNFAISRDVPSVDCRRAVWRVYGCANNTFKRKYILNTRIRIKRNICVCVFIKFTTQSRKILRSCNDLKVNRWSGKLQNEGSGNWWQQV